MNPEVTKLLVMCILARSEAPSPTGIHLPVVIHKVYAKLLMQFEGFHEFAHIEKFIDDEGREAYRLWALLDWQQSAGIRAQREAESKMSAKQWWTERWRTYKCTLFLRRMGMGKDNAHEMLENLLFTQDRIEASRAMLKSMGWFDTPTDEELEDFQQDWNGKPGYVYASPRDLTGNE